MERVEVKYLKPVPRQPDSWPPVRICGPSFCGASYTVGTSLTPCRQLFGRLSVLELITCEITLIGCSATFFEIRGFIAGKPLEPFAVWLQFQLIFQPRRFLSFSNQEEPRTDSASASAICNNLSGTYSRSEGAIFYETCLWWARVVPKWWPLVWYWVLFPLTQDKHASCP